MFHMFRTIAWGVLAGLLIGWQWAEFRGPEGAGKAQASGLPLTWSDTSNIRWKTAVHGRGWSSPVVLGADLGHDGDRGWQATVCGGARSGERQDSP
jgi:hypothetical protein